MDAGLLANACIVSTAVRSTSKGMPGWHSYAKGSGKSRAECCGIRIVLRSVYFGLQDVTCCEKTLFLFGSL